MVLDNLSSASKERLAPDYKPLQGQPERRLARLAGLSLDDLWAFFERLDLLGWCPGKKDRKCLVTRSPTIY